MATTQKWTPQDYPAAFNKLQPEVRDRAIEIGNRIMDENTSESTHSEVVPVAIERAREELGYDDKDLTYHLQPESGTDTDYSWRLARQGHDEAEERFKTKEEGLEKGLQLAQDQEAELVVHNMDGSIAEHVHVKQNS